MEKSWYQSKGILSGLVLIVLSLYQMLSGNTIDIASLMTLFTGTGIVGLRDAMK